MKKAKVTRYQIYAIDRNGEVVHAGAKDIPGTITVNKCKRLESAWERWRRDYIAKNPGDYPLRQYHKKTVQYIMHPIGNEEKSIAVNLAGNQKTIKPINIKDFIVL
ncbi:MAG: hypothetical protein JRI72_16370 [Deltaproteobacteria bacterium]|nr:hypothetical protein [Deltaproteobacteria bacterium]